MKCLQEIPLVSDIAPLLSGQLRSQDGGLQIVRSASLGGNSGSPEFWVTSVAIL